MIFRYSLGPPNCNVSQVSAVLCSQNGSLMIDFDFMISRDFFQNFKVFNDFYGIKKRLTYYSVDFLRSHLL